ncbi:hypothetical protein WMF27_37275 [Sorangium sp. So ce281]|uniref:hypothetical protein n=1 Tax=unclassified Sorangium TaxID=2621164 RepID=UPI003F6268B0
MNRRNERGRVLGEQLRHVVQEFRNHGQLLALPRICSGVSGELVTPSMSATSRVLCGVTGSLLLGPLVGLELFFVVVRRAMKSPWRVQGR